MLTLLSLKPSYSTEGRLDHSINDYSEQNSNTYTLATFTSLWEPFINVQRIINMRLINLPVINSMLDLHRPCVKIKVLIMIY